MVVACLSAAVVLAWLVAATGAEAADRPAASTTTTTTSAPATTTVPPPSTPPDPGPAPLPAQPLPAQPLQSTRAAVTTTAAPDGTAGLGEARSQYARLQRDADAALADWTSASAALDSVRTRMVQAKLAADAAAADAEAARRQLAQRATSLYRSGGSPDLVQVLGAGNLGELGTRSKYMQSVVGADRDLIARASETRERLEGERNRFDGSVAEAELVEGRMRDARDRVEAALQQQGYVVAKLDRTSRMAPANVMAGTAVRSGVGGARRDDMSVQAQVPPEGRVCPVGGPTTFSNDFGAPRSGPPPHPHQGNDIFASYGTPLVAIADGEIFKSGDDGGLGGQRVWLRDLTGVTYYYAHMSRIDVAAGTRVVRGQVLGAVGNSGNARTTPSHVHFEMHPGGGAAANPYGTLIRLC